MVTALYQVIAWAVVASAQRFDDEHTAAELHAQARRLRGARDAEQRRVDGMVHDRLIALSLALRPRIESWIGEQHRQRPR